MKKILVTGSLGQIGSDLVSELRRRYGNENVIASDIKPSNNCFDEDGPFEQLDCLSSTMVNSVIKRHNIDTIFHLAALLSAVAEEKPVNAANCCKDIPLFSLTSLIFFPTSILSIIHLF